MNGVSIIEMNLELSQPNIDVNFGSDISRSNISADFDGSVFGVTSVNGKIGTVVLTGDDIEYAAGETISDKITQVEQACDSYVHKQTTASDVWVIAHNLDKYPSVTIVDTGGSVVVGEITYIDTNTIQLQFAGAFSGTAYLN